MSKILKAIGITLLFVFTLSFFGFLWQNIDNPLFFEQVMDYFNYG